MGFRQKATLHDNKVDVKIILSSLWITMLFVFAYVDIFGFWRADIINGALAFEVPNTGFAINQTFLTLTTLYILVPSLMVAVSILAPARVNRRANLIVSFAYLATVAVSMMGETWIYYLLGSVVEMLLLIAIFRTAWSWPHDPTPEAPDRHQCAAGLAAPSANAGRTQLAPSGNRK